MPKKHVDVVRNDWFNGAQRLAARVSANGHGVHVETFEPGDWEELLSQAIRDPDAGEAVRPTDDTERYLRLLAIAWRGSYFFATDLHDVAHCKFPGDHDVVRMTSKATTDPQQS